MENIAKEKTRRLPRSPDRGDDMEGEGIVGEASKDSGTEENSFEKSDRELSL
jgi:hypothetical protein